MIIKRMLGYIKFLRTVDKFSFFYLNYFCKKVIRMDGSKIIPYKGAIIDLGSNTKIILARGDIEVGCDRLKKSKEETKIRLRSNAIWSSKGGCKISYNCTVEILRKGILSSEYFTMNSGSTMIIDHKIKIGKDVMFARNVIVYDSDFHRLIKENKKQIKSKEVIIGDHVWVGVNSIILKGVELKDGCVIAANTTVSKNVSNKILAGNRQEMVALNKNIAWER